jgi:hypothetical protein
LPPLPLLSTSTSRFLFHHRLERLLHELVCHVLQPTASAELARRHSAEVIPVRSTGDLIKISARKRLIVNFGKLRELALDRLIFCS